MKNNQKFTFVMFDDLQVLYYNPFDTETIGKTVQKLSLLRIVLFETCRVHHFVN